VLRDVLANEVPSLLRWDRDLYAVPAIVGACMVAVFLHYDVLTAFTTAFAVTTAFVLRLLALRFHWRAPRAWNRRSTVREVPEEASTPAGAGEPGASAAEAGEREKATA
jgi:uncharacterized membrane protein YeiH